MIKHLKDDKFNEEIKSRVLVDFYANWCGPCKMLGSVLENIAKELDIDVLKVDVDEYNDIARQYGVMSIPSLLLFENGKVIKQSVGFMDEKGIKEFIK